MKVQIILAQEELSVFASRMNIVNDQQTQIKQLQNELALNRNTLDAIWKSILYRWKLEKPEERVKLVFPPGVQLNLENGTINCEIADEAKEENAG